MGRVSLASLRIDVFTASKIMNSAGYECVSKPHTRILNSDTMQRMHNFLAHLILYGSPAG